MAFGSRKKALICGLRRSLLTMVFLLRENPFKRVARSRIDDPIGKQSARLVVDLKPPLQRRYRALGAIDPFANPARDAYRLEGVAIAKIKRIGVNETARIRNLASERDGISGIVGIESRAALLDLERDRKIGDAVWRLGELTNDTFRAFERLVNNPQRTGSSEACELQFGRAVPLGDIPRPVDTGEEYGHSPKAGPLQRA